MKQVNRINQFLIKNYPLVWNTKLVWLMLAGLFFHLFFFGLGFLNLNDPESLQKHNVEDNFFQNGAVFLNMLISTILIVGWLFFMFKNNSFKNFYPTSRSQLFKHFVLYFIIIVFNISFYYSFFYGMKASVNLNHPSVVVQEDVNIANHAAPFFSHHLDQYEISHRRYPLYLNDLFCETKSQFINLDKPYFKFLNEKYQFFTIKKIEKNRKDLKRNESGQITYEILDDSIFLYYYKDTVIDVSGDIQTAIPGYYNYSEVFFGSDNVHRFYYTYYSHLAENKIFTTDSLTKALVKSNQDLLSKSNPSEIKNVLNDFLQVAARYKIATNLTTENWFPLIYSDSFFVKNLIRNKAPDLNVKYDYYQDWDRKNRGERTNSYDGDENRKTLRQEYLEKLQTKFYLESPELRNVFFNIHNVKKANPFEKTIHFFMWFSFFLASLVFAFRISGLKSLIFSIITVGVLCVLLALIALAYEYIFRQSSVLLKIEHFIVAFSWIIATTILAIPILFLKKTYKIVSSIAINISMTFFALYIFLILAIIVFVQDYICDLNYPRSAYTLREEHCHNILQDVGIYWSYILFVFAFVFIYFFAGVIRKWRALPESK